MYYNFLVIMSIIIMSSLTDNILCIPLINKKPFKLQRTPTSDMYLKNITNYNNSLFIKK
jgi:hypothetical protein